MVWNEFYLVESIESFQGRILTLYDDDIIHASAIFLKFYYFENSFFLRLRSIFFVFFGVVVVLFHSIEFYSVFELYS